MPTNSLIILALVLVLVIGARRRSVSSPIRGKGAGFWIIPIVMLVGFSGFMDPKVHVTVTEMLLAAGTSRLLFWFYSDCSWRDFLYT